MTLATRRNAPVICAGCGHTVERKARQQRFCSTRCREKAKERSRKAFIGRTTAAPPNPSKNTSDINSLQGPKRWSSTGIQGPRKVIEAEAVAGRKWQETVSSDGVVSRVTTLRQTALVAP